MKCTLLDKSKNEISKLFTTSLMTNLHELTVMTYEVHISAASYSLQEKASLSVNVIVIIKLERCFCIHFQKLVGFILIDNLVQTTPR